MTVMGLRFEITAGSM